MVWLWLQCFVTINGLYWIQCESSHCVHHEGSPDSGTSKSLNFANFLTLHLMYVLVI